MTGLNPLGIDHYTCCLPYESTDDRWFGSYKEVKDTVLVVQKQELCLLKLSKPTHAQTHMLETKTMKIKTARDYC